MWGWGGIQCLSIIIPSLYLYGVCVFVPFQLQPTCLFKLYLYNKDFITSAFFIGHNTHLVSIHTQTHKTYPHMCIHVHSHVHIHTCIRVYMHIHTHRNLCLNLQLLIDRSIGRDLCEYVYSVHMRVCMYSFLYITQVLREVLSGSQQEFDKINFLKSISTVFSLLTKDTKGSFLLFPCSRNMFYVQHS